MAVMPFAASHLKVIDEKYFTKAKTDIVINKGIRLEFDGRRSVTIYNFSTVAEVDYVRDGANRFGQLVELGLGTQTFTLSQDKAFTYTIDRGNYADNMMVNEVGSTVKRQVREVSVPTTDKYRLGVIGAYAVANSQIDTPGAVVVGTSYQVFIDQVANLYDVDQVDGDKLVAFMTRATWNLLRRNTEFKLASDDAYADVKSGVVTSIDGVKIVPVPNNYLPSGMSWIIMAQDVLVAPTKFDMIRTLTEVQGIDGWVVEGRRYYDAFIPTYRGKAIRAHTTS
jgi:hypothetical protein